MNVTFREPARRSRTRLTFRNDPNRRFRAIDVAGGGIARIVEIENQRCDPMSPENRRCDPYVSDERAVAARLRSSILSSQKSHFVLQTVISGGGSLAQAASSSDRVARLIRRIVDPPEQTVGRHDPTPVAAGAAWIGDDESSHAVVASRGRSIARGGATSFGLRSREASRTRFPHFVPLSRHCLRTAEREIAHVALLALAGKLAKSWKSWGLEKQLFQRREVQ